MPIVIKLSNVTVCFVAFDKAATITQHIVLNTEHITVIVDIAHVQIVTVNVMYTLTVHITHKYTVIIDIAHNSPNSHNDNQHYTH